MRQALIAATVLSFVPLLAPPALARQSADTPPPPHHGDRQFDGRWEGVSRAPGGRQAYRGPARGAMLPPYWIQPQFYIADPQVYGLPSPPPGQGWSRYYDDAVLTDDQGRILDSRRNVAWDDDSDRGPPPPRHAAKDDPTYDGDYEGRWEGTWRTADGRVQSGTFEGRFEGRAQGDWQEPHWHHAEGPPPVYPAPGTIYGGYYYPAPVVTTIVVQPGTTTTVEETISYPSGHHRRVTKHPCRCK